MLHCIISNKKKITAKQSPCICPNNFNVILKMYLKRFRPKLLRNHLLFPSTHMYPTMNMLMLFVSF